MRDQAAVDDHYLKLLSLLWAFWIFACVGHAAALHEEEASYATPLSARTLGETAGLARPW